MCPVSSLFHSAKRIERSVVHVRCAQDPGHLHDQRRPRAVVVRGLAETASVHMGADDVHFLRMRRADLGAVDLLARPRRRNLRIERAERRIGLRGGVVVGDRRHHHAAQARAAGAGANFAARDGARSRRPCRRGRFRRPVVDVVQPLDRATVAREFARDPFDRGPVAVRALPAVAELGEPLDGRLVALEIEPPDQRADGIAASPLRRSGRRRGEQHPARENRGSGNDHDLSRAHMLLFTQNRASVPAGIVPAGIGREFGHKID